MTTNKLIRLVQISFLSIVLFMASCSDENIENSETDIVQAEVVKKYFGDKLLFVTEDENGNFFADDMMFTPKQLTDSPNQPLLDKSPDTELDDKLSLASYATKWPDGVVVYKLGNMSSALRGELQKAMDEWTSKTNVRFKKHTNESYYVTIQETNKTCAGCGFASIGVNGTRGTCNFGPKASASLIAHELGHTLGFLHEQTRPDRDQYVKVLFENIQSGKEGNFKKTNNALQTTKQFDMKSIMMYHPYAFTKTRGVPTIVDVKTGQPYKGAQQNISSLDIEGTNKVYPNTTDPDPDPDPDDICKGVDEWVSGKRYYVGDKVTYRGYLYEADYTKWNRIGKCGTSEPEDKCKGVKAWSGDANYNPGDQVTYNGTLYTLTKEKRWRNDGKCGS